MNKFQTNQTKGYHSLSDFCGIKIEKNEVNSSFVYQNSKHVVRSNYPQGILSKIYSDHIYYMKILEPLHRIHPASKYEMDLAQISSALQKLYEKISFQIKYLDYVKNTESRDLFSRGVK